MLRDISFWMSVHTILIMVENISHCALCETLSAYLGVTDATMHRVVHKIRLTRTAFYEWTIHARHAVFATFVVSLVAKEFVLHRRSLPVVFITSTWTTYRAESCSGLVLVYNYRNGVHSTICHKARILLMLRDEGLTTGVYVCDAHHVLLEKIPSRSSQGAF